MNEDCDDENDYPTKNWKQHQAGETDRPYLDASGITVRATEVYTEGDCWVLAWILLLDYRLAPVFVPGEYCGANDAEHVAVQLPSGDILDVRGVQSRKDFCKSWGCDPFELISVDADETSFLMELTEAVDPQAVPYELLERTREVADQLMSQDMVASALAYAE